MGWFKSLADSRFLSRVGNIDVFLRIAVMLALVVTAVVVTVIAAVTTFPLGAQILIGIGVFGLVAEGLNAGVRRLPLGRRVASALTTSSIDRKAQTPVGVSATALEIKDTVIERLEGDIESLKRTIQRRDERFKDYRKRFEDRLYLAGLRDSLLDQMHHTGAAVREGRVALESHAEWVVSMSGNGEVRADLVAIDADWAERYRAVEIDTSSIDALDASLNRLANDVVLQWCNDSRWAP